MTNTLTIKSDFLNYQAPTPEQQIAFRTLQGMAEDMARVIEYYCPDSQERSIAVLKMRESVMWAKTAITDNAATGDAKQEIPHPALGYGGGERG